MSVICLFAKMDTPVAPAHSRQISLDPRMCVNELLFLYRALSCCFGLLHCMAFTISDGKKHIKKQYKSKMSDFSFTKLAGWLCCAETEDLRLI